MKKVSHGSQAMRDRKKWVNLFKKRGVITGLKKIISSLERLNENLVWKNLEWWLLTVLCIELLIKGAENRIVAEVKDKQALFYFLM